MQELILTLFSMIDDEDKSSDFKNRLRKNYKHLRKWAKRTQTDCFRLYDRDIKEYPLEIDVYAGRFCVHYFSEDRDDDEPAYALKSEIENTLCSLFGVHSNAIYWRTHIRRKKLEQYEKLGDKKEFFTVHEYGVKFNINLIDYLDTGLFLDHRETRRMVSSISKGKRLLNLFAYTCSFSVHAAMIGASYTKSVDLSNTYTQWGKDNFLLNMLSLKNNQIIRADCLKFLDEEIALEERYDIIVVDPPTISRSKKMDQMFDLQSDYSSLLFKALELLVLGGVLFFSTNSRKFAFDSTLFASYEVQEITPKTIGLDFRSPKVHRCWKMTRTIHILDHF